MDLSKASCFPDSSTSRNHVKDVWKHDIRQEFAKISELSVRYNYVAVAVRYPGNVINQQEDSEDDYRSMKNKVNIFPPFQIALSLYDSRGNIPHLIPATWQFNLKLDDNSRPVTDSLRYTGFDFERHEREGIDYGLFTELLIANRLVLVNKVTWLTFGGVYHFGYLIRLLTGFDLPEEEIKFHETYNIYFQKLYDARYLMALCAAPQGNLETTARRYKLERAGPIYYAGGEAKLVGSVFFTLKRTYFEEGIADSYSGRIYKLNYF